MYHLRWMTLFQFHSSCYLSCMCWPCSSSLLYPTVARHCLHIELHCALTVSSLGISVSTRKYVLDNCGTLYKHNAYMKYFVFVWFGGFISIFFFNSINSKTATPKLRPLHNYDQPAITTTISRYKICDQPAITTTISRYKICFNSNSMVVCSEITTIPHGLYFVVVLMGLTETKLG